MKIQLKKFPPALRGTCCNYVIRFVDQLDIFVSVNTAYVSVIMVDLFRQSSAMSWLVVKSSAVLASCSMVYHAVTLAVGDLPGDLYTNTVLMAGMDLLSHLVFPYFMEQSYCGRVRMSVIGLSSALQQKIK